MTEEQDDEASPGVEPVIAEEGEELKPGTPPAPEPLGAMIACNGLGHIWGMARHDCHATECIVCGAPTRPPEE